MIQIDEPLPDDPLASEVVLHLRLHLKRAIRSRASAAPGALAMLFGFARSDGAASDWIDASASPEPLLAGAEVAARRRGIDNGVVALGHDGSHLTECKAWLLERKQEDDTFEKLLATDLATLLELSKARDLAIAMGRDEAGGERPLPILIQGDTGAGKELLAEAIHNLWKKSCDEPKAPFVVAQVAGLPHDLAIDELFGHVKGAYTNAIKDRNGRIHLADGGTLLIDEVGDLPPEAQVRLLRFLQTRRISRTGEDAEQAVQVRVLAATWRDLKEMVAQGAFRKDLYYRLCNGTSLRLPPLTKREGLFEEVVPEILKARGHRARPLLARNAREALKAHDWPGNLRELVGVLELASSLAQGSTIRLEHLPDHLQRQYLQLPLIRRAPGYLAEELDSRELTEEHARWRVDRIEQQLAAYMPEANASITQVEQLLATLPGNLPEHEEAVHAVSQWSEVERLARRHEELAQYWEELIKTGLPEVVVRALQETASKSRGLATELRQRMGDYERTANLRLEQDPWLKLMAEVRSIPLFSEAESGEMAKFIRVVYGIMEMFNPAQATQVLDDVRRGVFLQRLQSKTAPDEKKDEERQSDAGATNTSQRAEPKKVSPKDRPPEFWQQLTTTYKSQAEASKATGYDPKTINLYLEKYDVPNPWRVSHRSEPSEAALQADK